MNIARIAARVAFGIRRAFDHVDQRDICKLLALDSSLMESFGQAMSAHDEFMMELYSAAADRLSDFMIRRLKFLRSGLVRGLKSLVEKMRERFPEANLSDVESMVDDVLGEEIINPNTMIQEMNFWASEWHDAFTKLAYKAFELLTDEKKPRTNFKN